MTDEELLIKAKSGESGANEELWARYKRPVCAIARKYFLSDVETEDLIQEGMIGLYNAVRDYDFSRENKLSFKNFAYLCIKRRIGDEVEKLLRRTGGATPLSIEGDNVDKPDELDLEGLVIEGEAKAEFWQKIGKALSDFEFRIVVMYLEGMTYAEIAETTGKTVKSVDNALTRSKKKLQKIYG